DPRLSDAVAGAVAVLAEALQLVRRDLPCVAEHLRGERRVRISAQIDLRDLHAREIVLVLVEVVDLLLADGRLHDDRGERVEAMLRHLAHERPRRDAEHTRELPDDPVPPPSRQVSDPELHRGAGDVRHDHTAAAIEERATGSLDADEPELVALRRVQVGVSGEHLQRPEPEEQHDEREQRDTAEDRHPQRELRRQAMRLANTRVRRQEPAGRCTALLVRPGGHTTTSTSPAGSPRSSSPTIARTSRWTGSARITFVTNAGRSVVTRTSRATTSSPR